MRMRGEFIDGPAGPLAIVLREPDSEVRDVALFLPAFGDEMNKSRRMVALQARALAAQGWVVATLDPRGTGDSAGEHAAATWGGWRDDAICAWDWLSARYREPSLLWGLRLGALLATDLVASTRVTPETLLFWQPATSGKLFFQQVLRAAKARSLIADEPDAADVRALRATLRDRRAVEVGGYELHPDLIAGAEAADAPSRLAGDLHVVLREVSIASPAQLSPAVERFASRFSQAGARVDAAAVHGASFWAAQEIAEVPALVDSTTLALGARQHSGAPA